ncbi:DUF6701 domain-containing protein [Vibrio sp. PNB22_4_2]
MKKLFKVVTLMLLVSASSLTYGQPSLGICEIQTNSQFSVGFTVTGSDAFQAVYFEHSGNHADEVVWYTQSKKSDTDSKIYHFNEQHLTSGQVYEIKIFHDAKSNNLSKYYRRIQGQSRWQLIGTMNKAMKHGKLSVYANGTDISGGHCDPNATEPPLTDLPDYVCEVFPEPIQGWRGSTSILNISNDSARALGWSEEYKTYPDNIYRYQQSGSSSRAWDNIRVGFDIGTEPWPLYENPAVEICDGLGCFPKNGRSASDQTAGDDGLTEARKVKAPAEFTPNFGRFDLHVSSDLIGSGDQARPEIESICDDNPDICRYEYYGDNRLKVNVLSSLSRLEINNPGDNPLFDELTIELANGIQIGELEISNGRNVVFKTLDNSAITLGTWKENTGDTKYSFGLNSIINISSSFVMSNPMDLANNNSVLFYAPTASVRFQTKTNEFYGYILAKEVKFENPITIYGAVTSQDLTMRNRVVIQKPNYSCPFTPIEDGNFFVEPQWQYGLTCDRIPVEFKLLDEQGEYIESNASFYPTVSGDQGTSWCESAVGADCGVTSANLSSGRKTLYLSTTDIGKLQIGATYESKPYSGGEVEFVPYKLHAQLSPVEMIAGRAVNVEVKALACRGEQATAIKGYNQNIVLSEDSFNLKSPASGKLYDFDSSDLLFKNGVASTVVSWSDVGHARVAFEDKAFDCRQYQEAEDSGIYCPIDGGVLKGEFSIKSRPWKIAACNIMATKDGKHNPASQAGGEGFIPSSESFSVTYKPVVHSDGKGNANTVCDYPVTQNYFSDADVSAPLNTEFSVAYPSTGDIANLAGGQHLAFSKEEAKSGKAVEYVWNEVGSLNLKTKTTYLEMSLDEDNATIGRFYPKYFQVKGSAWIYPDSQNFAYMGQPFDGVSYSVEALNANEGSLKNYALFESANQAMFNIDELSPLSERFDAPDSTARWGLVDKSQSIGDFTISGNSLCGVDSANRKQGSACWIKDFSKIHEPKGYADGPYNTNTGGDASHIGLVYGNNADPASYLNEGEIRDSRLIKQPDIRFGRVNLSDAGEKQGTDTVIHIPLRIEYWNGSRFTLNLDDSQTRVLGDKAKQVHMWPTGDDVKQADVELSAGGQVISGRSRSIEAQQVESNRQQTRVWLNLDLSGNDLPWLKYNWDKEQAGEENPSSVVTFGIHRGNDRVIYRGEPGITGQ